MSEVCPNCGTNEGLNCGVHPIGPLCPNCKYSEHDAKFHGDHHLCRNAGNAPWEKRKQHAPKPVETEKAIWPNTTCDYCKKIIPHGETLAYHKPTDTYYHLTGCYNHAADLGSLRLKVSPDAESASPASAGPGERIGIARNSQLHDLKRLCKIVADAQEVYVSDVQHLHWKSGTFLRQSEMEEPTRAEARTQSEKPSEFIHAVCPDCDFEFPIRREAQSETVPPTALLDQLQAILFSVNDFDKVTRDQIRPLRDKLETVIDSLAFRVSTGTGEKK